MTTPELKPIQADLLPCPWCSSKDLRLEVDDIDGWIGFYKCGNCDAVGPMTEYKYEDQAEAGREAITAWNTRLNHKDSPMGGEEWLPIETAPKGKSFLAAIHHGQAGYLVVHAKWVGTGVYDTMEDSCVGWRPSHKHPAYWRPLPAPPADHNGGGR